jgi:hypothetical protein
VQVAKRLRQGGSVGALNSTVHLWVASDEFRHLDLARLGWGLINYAFNVFIIKMYFHRS